MLILSLETSTELGSCALWRDGDILERFCPEGVSHSETLLPLVRELLETANISVSQLDGIAYGSGPGAFTGLRVACAAAQGLAVAANALVLPVGSLETMAAKADADQVLALLDARMSEVYYGAYSRSSGAYQLIGDVRVATPSDIVFPLGSSWLACGNAPEAYPVLLERLKADGIAFLPGIMPTASVLARLAAPRFAQGEGVDPSMAAPVYIRDKVAKTILERLEEGGRA